MFSKLRLEGTNPPPPHRVKFETFFCEITKKFSHSIEIICFLFSLNLQREFNSIKIENLSFPENNRLNFFLGGILTQCFVRVL